MPSFENGYVVTHEIDVEADGVFEAAKHVWCEIMHREWPPDGDSACCFTVRDKETGETMIVDLELAVVQTAPDTPPCPRCYERLNPPGLGEGDKATLRQRARDQFTDSEDNVAVDDDAGFSVADDAVWVQAWLRVENDQWNDTASEPPDGKLYACPECCSERVQVDGESAECLTCGEEGTVSDFTECQTCDEQPCICTADAEGN